MSTKDKASEHLLDHYALAPPPDALRDRVLATAPKKSDPPLSEIVLRYALVALVVTQVWAYWQEGQTAERMARLARESLAIRYAEHGTPEPTGNDLHTALTAAIPALRMRMPLPPGYPSTRVEMWHTTLEFNYLEGSS